MAAFTSTIASPATLTGISATFGQNVAAAINAFGPWPAYTPTWTSAGTAPVLGNGTLIGAYIQIEHFVVARVTLTMGSTTTYGTGNYYFSLPVSASGPAAATYMPWGSWAGSPAGTRSNGICVPQSTSSFYMEVGGTATVVGQLTPGTWASTNIICAQICYESA